MRLPYDSLGFSANVVFNISGPKISFISTGGTPNTYVQPRLAKESSKVSLSNWL